MNNIVDIILIVFMLAFAAIIGLLYFLAAVREATPMGRRHGITVALIAFTLGLLSASQRSMGSEVIAASGSVLLSSGALGGVSPWLYDRWRMDVRRPLPHSLAWSPRPPQSDG